MNPYALPNMIAQDNFEIDLVLGFQTQLWADGVPKLCCRFAARQCLLPLGIADYDLIDGVRRQARIIFICPE